MSREERTAIIGTIAALAVGAAIALAGSDNGEEVGGLRVFALCAILSYGINLVAFVIAYIRQTEHFFDLTGSLTYLTLVVIALILGPTDWRAVLLAVLIGIWATRLGTFLFRRIRRRSVRRPEAELRALPHDLDDPGIVGPAHDGVCPRRDDHR